MSLQTRNKVSAMYSMASLTDIVFLLLIFFMLTSTLISPNALKLLLPSSNSQTLAKQTISVSISEELEFYVGRQKVSLSELPETIRLQVSGEKDPTIVLNAGKTVPIEQVVHVMDIANDLKVKMILATNPRD